jgi:hypothetical protein
MARYGEGYGGDVRGYDRGWRTDRSRAGGPAGHRAGARGPGRYEYDAGFAGWGMTRMYRHMMRGERRPYNPPLGGRTEYSRTGGYDTEPGRFDREEGRGYARDFRSARTHGYPEPGERSSGGRAPRPAGEIHGVRMDRDRYERDRR